MKINLSDNFKDRFYFFEICFTLTKSTEGE